MCSGTFHIQGLRQGTVGPRWGQRVAGIGDLHHQSIEAGELLQGALACCEACVPECPVEAIFHEDDVPDDQQDYVQLNSDKSQGEGAENITEKKDPLC